MSSSDMLHMFRDYMDSYDQLRLIRKTMRTKPITIIMIKTIMGCKVAGWT